MNYLIQENQKKTYMEFLRMIAAFCVIANHINNPTIFYTSVSKSWYATIIVFYISKIAVPIFLMISGSLLLSKKDSIKKYSIRIVKFVGTMILFSTIYYVYFFHNKEFDFVHYVKTFLGSATIAYWYVFLYLGILIMLPILQKLAKALSKKELQLFLIISLVFGGIIPIFNIFTGIQIENEFLEVLFSPYLGMLFVGYYMDHYVTLTKEKAWGAVGVFCILIALQVLLTRYLYAVDSNNYMQLDDRTSFFISTSAICVYIIVKYMFMSIKIPKMLEKIIVYCGSLTFGIFLLGDLFHNILLPIFKQYYQNINIFIAIVIYAICVYLCSGLCTAVLKCIPLLKKIL